MLFIKITSALKRYVTVSFGILILLIVTGCVSARVQTLEKLPLPDGNNHCCWQAFQQLDIRYKNEIYKLNAVVAVTQQGTALVLLDPFGRRLFSLSKHDGLVEIYRSPELPETLPADFLLATSLLAWLPITEWQALLARPENASWQININNFNRLLSYKGKALLRFNYPANAISLEKGIGSWTTTGHEILEVHHLYQPLNITISTERWDAL